MSSSLRRGALAASVIAFSVASLAACGAGNNAQTLGVRPDNAATSVGDIKVQNAVVIVQPGTTSEGPAAVSATLFNSGDRPQTVDSITVDGVGAAEVKPAGGSGPLTVPAGGSVVVGGDGNASAMLSNGSALEDGAVQKVTFAFSETGDVVLSAFVVPAQSYFSSWGPSDVPAAPESTAPASEEPAAGASESAGDRPAGEESASASAGEPGAAES